MALLWRKRWVRPQPEQNRYQLVKSTHGAPAAPGALSHTTHFADPVHVKLAVMQSLPISMRSIILRTEDHRGLRRTDECLLCRELPAAPISALDLQPVALKLIDFSTSRPI